MHAVFFALLTITPLVAGHGYLGSMDIDGKTYKGNAPGSSSGESLFSSA